MSCNILCIVVSCGFLWCLTCGVLCYSVESCGIVLCLVISCSVLFVVSCCHQYYSLFNYYKCMLSNKQLEHPGLFSQEMTGDVLGCLLIQTNNFCTAFCIRLS